MYCHCISAFLNFMALASCGMVHIRNWSSLEVKTQTIIIMSAAMLWDQCCHLKHM
jgi:hypothetical protein